MSFLFNYRSKSEKIVKIVKIEKIGKIGKIGKIERKQCKFGIFCKNSKIYVEIHILTGFQEYTCIFGHFVAFVNFWCFINNIPEIRKYRDTYPQEIRDIKKNISDFDLRFLLKVPQMNSKKSHKITVCCDLRFLRNQFFNISTGGIHPPRPWQRR